MRKFKLFFVALFTLGLIGCSTIYNSISVNSTLGLDNDQSIQSIQTMSQKALYGVSTNNLCVAYYQNHPPLVKKEIERRGLITSSGTWSDIDAGTVSSGMSLCQVLAAMGKPQSLSHGDQFLELNYNGKTILLNKQQGQLTVVTK